MRILIVEDESIVARDIGRHIEQLGYSVAGHATTGEEALTSVQLAPPDLILLDIGLRGSIDGVETARRIRERYDTPIIFLTAYSDHVTLQRAKATNPFGYLLKPFDERELYSAIEMARHHYELEKALRESEARFRDLFDEAPLGYHELDAEGRITRINRTELEMFGYSREEMIGRSVMEFLVDPDTARTSLAGRLAGKRMAGGTLECTFKRKDGTTIPVSMTEKLVYNARGTIDGLRTTVQDISKRRKAEEERDIHAAHLSALAQSAMQFAEMSAEEDIYAFIGTSLRESLGNAYVLVNRYDASTDTLTVQHMAAPPDFISRAVELLGGDKTGQHYPIDDDARLGIASGKLVSVEGGLYRLTFGRFPETLCRLVEKTFGLHGFYSIGFVRKNEFLGNAIILLHGRHSRLDTKAVEAFAHQASSALYRRASEEALRESEQKLRTFISQSPDGMILLEESGSIVEWNVQMERLSGIPHSAVAMKKLWEAEQLLIGDDELSLGIVAKHRERIEQALVTGTLPGLDRFSLQFRHRSTGHLFTIAIAASVIRTNFGHMLAVNVRDMTEQIQTEERIQRSEQDFRVLWEKSFDGMRLIDDNGIILMANHAFCRLVNLSMDELIGKPFAQVYDKRHQVKMLEREKELIAARTLESHFERKYILWDGRAVWFQLSNSFIERSPGSVLLLSIFRDVTKRHHAEEALRFQAEILSHVGDTIIVTDDAFAVTYLNAAAEEMYATAAGTALGRPINELFQWHESVSTGQDEIFSEAAARGVSRFENIQVLPNGGEFLAELTISRSTERSNQKQAYIVVVRDVTVRRRAEEALRSNEQKYRAVIERSHDGIVLVDEGGVIIEWNSGQEQMTGIARHDAVGKLIWDVQYALAPPEKRTQENYERIKENGLRFVNTGTIGSAGTIYENIIQRSDGTQCTAQIIHSPIQTDKGFMIMSIARALPAFEESRNNLLAGPHTH